MDHAESRDEAGQLLWTHDGDFGAAAGRQIQSIDSLRFLVFKIDDVDTGSVRSPLLDELTRL